MRFELIIDNMNGAEFEELGREEVTARVLRVVADRIKDGDENGVLRDINGGRIGHFTFTG